MAAANDVVDDDAGIDVALVHVLAKHALAVLLLCPIDLLRTERVAHTEGYGNSAGTGTDDGDFRQLAGNIAVDAKLAAERYRQDARRIVVTKRQRHLEIVRGMFAVRVDKVALAKRSGAFQNLHDLFRRRNQLDAWCSCHSFSSGINLFIDCGA